MKNQEISIQFLGAAGTVTGSKHLLKTSELNILIDCGLFQGLKNLRLKNREELPLNIKSIDYVIITHAHLDHCGYIPLLVKLGYKGKFIMTPPTRDLAEIILLDSAKIQEEDSKKANEEKFSKHEPAEPLYKEIDVEKALKQFSIVQDEEWHQLSENVSFNFKKNGHIIGSSLIEFKCYDKTIVFSGDLGRIESDLLPAPSVIDKADYLVLESTYGDRNHPEIKAIDDLENVILNALEKKGTLIIPSFAVGRAQEIMYLINELKEQKRIPNIPVYLDSPMGTDATEIFIKHQRWHKLEQKEAYKVSRYIHVVKDVHESKKIVKNDQSKIIIAASGMLTGGRVLNYIKELAEDSRNSILLVGYQGEGTRGRALKEGAKELKMHGKYIDINAQVFSIDTLSAHADQKQMIDWVKQMNKTPDKILLVHGEPQALNIFRVKLQDEIGCEVVIPELYQEIKL